MEENRRDRFISRKRGKLKVLEKIDGGGPKVENV